MWSTSPPKDKPPFIAYEGLFWIKNNGYWIMIPYRKMWEHFWRKRERMKKDLDTKTENVIDFEEARKALDAEGSYPTNWLKSLPEGTYFLTKERKDPTPFLSQFVVLQHIDNKSSIIKQTYPEDKIYFVESETWSILFKKVSILKKEPINGEE